MQNIKKILKEYKIVFIILFLIGIVRTMIFEYFYVPSGSMYPTLKIGEHIFVNELAYGLRLPFSQETLFNFKEPERGDMIVFHSKSGEVMVKRVIGLPGDTIRVKDDELFINGKKVEHKPLSEAFDNDPRFPLRNVQKLTEEDFNGSKHNILTVSNKDMLANSSFYKIGLSWRDSTIIAKKGEVIVLGDNRDNSLDSRFWGALPLNRIMGKVVF